MYTVYIYCIYTVYIHVVTWYHHFDLSVCETRFLSISAKLFSRVEAWEGGRIGYARLSGVVEGDGAPFAIPPTSL